ncbi:MAG: metallophosphoesterase [Planctomycetes bacterium]|nr:metallophosphoesterase [Planctomycetota bacterium]
MALLRTLVADAVLAGVLGLSVPARGDSLASLPDPTYADPAGNAQTDPVDRRVGAIVYPTLGFPALVVPGDEVRVHVRLADGGVTVAWDLSLVTASDPRPQTWRLVLVGADYDAAGVYRLRGRVPAGAPRDCYDLVVRAAGLPGGADAQPVAVRVLEGWRQDFRFAHIADNQTRDIRTADPSLVGRTLAELRFLDPEFTVFSGDWNYGADYFAEYPENHDIWRTGRLATFLVPGNHDGYATVRSGPAGQPAVERDGLAYWRQTCGPLHYSFDYGERLHFAAVNSYDGSAERRNGRGVTPINFGGQVDPAQLAWLEADLRSATAAGRDTVLFLHHDPRGPYRPNWVAYPFNPLKVVRASQQWNDEASGRELVRLAREHRVTHVLMGHDHEDAYEEEVLHPGTSAQRVLHWVHTTTMAVSLGNRVGYRLVQVQGGRLVEVHYDPPKSQSVPVDPAGNHLRLVEQGPNDGSASRVAMRVTNNLPRDLKGALKFFLLPSSAGYLVRGGLVRRAVESDDGTAVLYVDVAVASGQTVQVEAEPAGAAGGVVPVASSDGRGGARVGPGPTLGRGGRTGCAVLGGGGPPGEPWTLLPLALLAGAAVCARGGRGPVQPRP